MFGSYEGEQSAYGGQLDDSKPFVALPFRFEGKRPTVELMNEDGDIFDATIEDVGPWMINDAYWDKGTRPIAEQCYASKTPIPSGPQKGRVPSNPAGIDLSSVTGQVTRGCWHGQGVVAAGADLAAGCYCNDLIHQHLQPLDLNL